jgi:hypothetical protein
LLVRLLDLHRHTVLREACIADPVKKQPRWETQ